MCWTHCHGPVPLHTRQRSWDRSWSPAGCSPRCWSPCRCSISETHLENSTQSVWSIQSTRLYQVINWCKYEKEWISAGTGAVAGIIVLVLVLMTKWGLILNKDTWFMAVHINSILSTLRAVSFQCMITYPSFNISLITIRTGKSLKLVLCTNHPVHLLQRTNTVPTPLLPFGKVYLTVWKPSPSIKQLSWSTPFRDLYGGDQYKSLQASSQGPLQSPPQQSISRSDRQHEASLTSFYPPLRSGDGSFWSSRLAQTRRVNF